MTKDANGRASATVRVKLHPKVKALELLMKAIGLIATDRPRGRDESAPAKTNTGMTGEGVRQLYEAMGMPALPEATEEPKAGEAEASPSEPTSE